MGEKQILGSLVSSGREPRKKNPCVCHVRWAIWGGLVGGLLMASRRESGVRQAPRAALYARGAAPSDHAPTNRTGGAGGMVKPERPTTALTRTAPWYDSCRTMGTNGPTPRRWCGCCFFAVVVVGGGNEVGGPPGGGGGRPAAAGGGGAPGRPTAPGGGGNPTPPGGGGGGGSPTAPGDLASGGLGAAPLAAGGAFSTFFPSNSFINAA